MSVFTKEQQAQIDGLTSDNTTAAAGSTGASGKGGSTFDRLLNQESGGSQFNDDGSVKTSKKGAIGIAQVMPATGPEAAKLAGLPWDENRYRKDPEYNKALGRAYFEEQLRTFGDERTALAAYNAGPGATAKAVARAKREGGDFLAYLPEETRKYVPAIMGGKFSAKPLPNTPEGRAMGGSTAWGQQPRYQDPGFNAAFEREALLDAADESPVSTSLGRGWEGLKHNAGLFLDNVTDDSQGAAERIKAKRQWDEQNPAPRSSQGFVEDWQRLAEDDYAGMFATFAKNPGGALNQMVEQTPNSLPALAIQIPVGIASSALYATGVGAPLAMGLQAVAAFVGNVLPEGGAIIEERLAKSGINPNDTAAVAKWIAENRGANLEAGIKKAGGISLVDGATGMLAGKLIAGPTIRFTQAEAQVLAKAGVNTTDKAAVAAARATPAYKQAMAAPAKDLLDATTRAQKIVREVGGFSLEAAGEGVGEYAGSYAANGEASVKDAILEGAMGAGTSAAMTGANMALGAAKGPDMDRTALEALAATPQPTIKPNSPLSNAAGIAQAAQPAPTAQPNPTQVDPFAERLTAMQSFVEDKAFIQALRGSQGYGPESVTEALSAFAKARNPNLDPKIRERALADLETFVQGFSSRPNFVFGQNAPEQATPPGQQVSTINPQGGAVAPATPRDDGRTLNGEVITRPEKMAGANQNQLSAPPVLGLPTEEALNAKRDADAAYEQAYQDLVKAEQLGESDAQIMARQQAIRDAREAQEQADARLKEIEQTIDGNRAQRTAAKRRAVLDAILADPDTANPAARFSAELNRQGFLDSSPTQDELAAIQRFDDLKAADFQPDVEPAAPNELDLYEPPKQAAKPAGKRFITPADIRRMVADGANLSKDTLTLPDGSTVRLKGPHIAAARKAISDRRKAQDGTQPGTPNAEVASEAPEERGSVVSGSTGNAPADSDGRPEGRDGADAAVTEPGLRADRADGDGGLVDVAQPEIRSAIDAAAHEAATSPLNDTPQPTDAQKEAGNYKVGRIRIQGMDISIENPKGSKRSGVSPDGVRWESTMAHHYGYFPGTKAADGDNLDVFVTDGAEDAPSIFIIDQRNQDGSFDEQKVVFGPRTEEEARAAYLANYEPGWTGLGAISSMPVDAFKSWAFDGKKKSKPLAYVVPKPRPAKAIALVLRVKDNYEELIAMANDAGWQERGGQLLRDASGEVAGRTKWLPRAEWFVAGMEANPDVLRTAIERINDGNFVVAKSRRTVEGMVEWLEAQRGEVAPEDRSAYDHDPMGYLDVGDPAADFYDSFDDLLSESPLTGDEAMRALGFTEDEINEAANAGRATASRQGKAGQAEPDSAQAGRQADRPGDGEQGNALESYTEQDLAARDEAQRLAEESRAKAERDANNKARADADRDTFTLTGSDRPADVLAAQGQGGLFESTAPVTVANGRLSSEEYRNEGKSPADLIEEKADYLGRQLAMTIAEEASQKDFAPSEIPSAVRMWANDERVPADSLRIAVLKHLPDFGLSDGRIKHIRNALSPLNASNQEPVKNETPANTGDSADTDAGNQEPIKNAEPSPLDFTPKQYHEARMKWVAQEYGLSNAEVRQDYDTDAARKADDNAWVAAVRQAFKEGRDVPRSTLDKLEELRPGAFGSFLHDYPDAKVPAGYQTPDARATEKASADAKKDARSDVAQPSGLASIFTGLASRGLAKSRAKKAAEANPRAAQIAYVQNNFHDILTELEDKGLVKINCD